MNIRLKKSFLLLLALVLVISGIIPSYAKAELKNPTIETNSALSEENVKTVEERIAEILSETLEPAKNENSSYEPITALSLVQYGEDKQEIASKVSFKSKWMKSINSLSMDIMIAKSLGKDIENYNNTNLLEEIKKKELNSINNLEQFIWTVLAYENVGIEYNKLEALSIFNTQYEKNKDPKFKAMTLLITDYLENGQEIKENILAELKGSQIETGEVVNAETTSYLINGLIANGIDPNEWKHENGTSVVEGLLNLYASQGKFKVTQSDKWGKYSEINFAAMVALRDRKTPFRLEDSGKVSYRISLVDELEEPIHIKQGQETKIPIKIYDKDNEEVEMETVWTTESDKVNIVEDNILGISIGEAKIKVEIKGYSQFYLEISLLIEPAELEIAKLEVLPSTTRKIVLGETPGKLEVISKDKNNIIVEDDYTYSVNPTDVVEVDNDGNLFAVSEGQATITIKSNKNEKVSTDVKVYVYSTVEDSENTIDDFIETTIEYYKKGNKNLIALETKALTRAGVDLKGWNASTNVFKHDYQKNSLSSMAKQVEVLLEIGEDPTDYQGRNLVQEIRERVGVENQKEAESVYIDGLNGLFSYYAKTQDKVEELDYRVYKENILELQLPDGSFKTASITGDALVALSQLPQDNEVKTAIESALSFLKANQKDNGAITTTVAFTDINAKVIRGLLAVGEDPTSEKWSIGETNLVEALFLFLRDDKGFDDRENASLTGGSWVTATQEALEALLDLKEYGYGGYVVKTQSTKETIKEDKTVNVEIAILTGEKPYAYIYRPAKVSVNSIENSYGLTVLGALESTKIPFTNDAGYVSEISGFSAQGLGGWKYSVNDIEPVKLPLFYDLEDGDRVVWYYVSNYDVKIPEWSDIISTTEEVNKDELNGVITEAEVKKQEDYTPETWTQFEAALEAAKDVARNNDATQVEVNAAKTVLEAAMTTLEPKAPVVNKDALNEVIAEAEVKKQEDYTPESWAEFEAALADAKTVAKKENVTQGEVDAAKEALKNAIDSLVPVTPVDPQPGVVDKTDLESTIDRAERVDKDKYTNSTVRRLEEAIESARRVLRDDNATQVEVNAAESELIRAINSLEEIDNREPNYNENLNWLIFGDGSDDKKEEAKPEQKPEVKPEMVDIAGHWAETVIKYVVDKEYFNGIDSTHFAPNQATTRGEFITVLGRLAKVDKSKYGDSKASDINSGQFYSEYANWAITEGIVSGYEDGTFRGDQTLTREEMAVFLNNTLKFMNRNLVESEVASFADEGDISEWALESIKVMTANGYLKGRDGNAFDPKAELTRAEIAQIIYNVDTK